MKFLSVASGIEAASVAWHPLGWEAVGFSEIEPFPCAVLAERWPDVPNFGDMTKFKEWPDVRPDVLVGGTPCQSFSVAGLRAGMADPRGQLALVFLAIADRFRPEWVVWENVPGVLSADEGRVFGAFLGGLAELGYGWAYRVLDAQFFGVAQRRRRVFVVGHLGDWRRAAAVLFERASLRGHPPPSREEGERVARPVAGSSPKSSGYRNDADRADDLVTHTHTHRIAKSLNAHGGRFDYESETMVTHSLRAGGFDASEDGTGRGTPLVPVAYGISSDAVDRSGEGNGTPGERAGLGIVRERTPSLRARPNNAVAYRTSGNCGVMEQGDKTAALNTATDPNQNIVGVDYQNCALASEPICGTIDAAQSKMNRGQGVLSAMQVRRLTPRESERLQGFPDDYTLVNYRGKPACDGPRYKALGNSMAVPVMRWIGERIDMVRRTRNG